MDNPNTPRFKQSWARLQNTTVYKVISFIANSAAIALLITAVLFVVQECEEQKRTNSIVSDLKVISEDMKDVQNSITTRYLGIFPDYIDKIDNLLEDFQASGKASPNDTIIIFEDVLYYGIKSKPESFIKMNKLLYDLADKGCHIVVAYYDPGDNNIVFNRYIQEELLSPTHCAQMRQEMMTFARQRLDPESRRERTDSLIQHYYELSRDASEESRKDFAGRVMGYRKKIYSDAMPTVTYLDIEMVEFCHELDSIKTQYMGDARKDIASVSYNDFLNMYKALDNQIKNHFVRGSRAKHVEMIPLNEYLTMSCWLVNGHTILAFPSKYATQEIGFESRDKAFVDYIITMLEGVRSSNHKPDKRKTNIL